MIQKKNPCSGVYEKFVTLPFLYIVLGEKLAIIAEIAEVFFSILSLVKSYLFISGENCENENKNENELGLGLTIVVTYNS